MDSGALATIGRRAAVADLGGVKLRGFLAWVFWCMEHVRFLIGFRNRLQVTLGWIWSYLTFERGARLVFEAVTHRAGSPPQSSPKRVPGTARPGQRPHWSFAMEMQQVRYFLALARNLNFTRAAEQANITQPALTRAIQQLEHDLGGPLFHRERNRTHLTELGRMMLPYLEQIQTQSEAARHHARSLRSLDDVNLRLEQSSA